MKRQFTLYVFVVGKHPEARTVEMDNPPGYDQLRDVITPLLDGGDLEHVSVLHNRKRADMFVDENGQSKDLPRNEAATTIYRNNWLTQHPEVDPESLPCIYGTAILFDRIVWN